MKKIFTLFAGLMLAGTAVANAEAVTLQVCTSKGVELAKSCETELTRDKNGNYVIADFLNSGEQVAFNFDSNVQVGEKTKFEIKGNFEIEYDDYANLLDASKEDIVCEIHPLEGDKDITVYYPFIYIGGTYSYVTRLNKAEDDYDYLARMTFSGYDENGDALSYYYIFMYFDEIPYDGSGEEENPGDDDPAATLINSLNVTVDIDGAYYYPDYNDYSKYEEKSLKSFDAVLDIYDDGTYTLKNIFGTEYSISYTISNYSPKHIALITFTGNITADEGYEDFPDFLTPNGKYMTVTPEEENGEKLTVKYLYGNQGIDYSYAQQCTAAEIAEGSEEYYIYLNLSGYVNNNEGLLDMDLSFGYTLTTTGVSDVKINAVAPVEYYNLNGQRVAEPSNGIFIRRQGNQTSKVMIK